MARFRLERVYIARQRLGELVAETPQYIEVIPVGGGPRARYWKAGCRPRPVQPTSERRSLWRRLFGG
jgi:hypothetical protein